MSNEKFHYHMVHAEVICQINGEVNILNSQFFTKADVATFRAARLRHVQNTAAHKIFSRQPPAAQKTFVAIDVIIKNLMYLGEMTDADFWDGMGDDAPAEDAVARGETPPADNVVALVQPAAAADTNQA